MDRWQSVMIDLNLMRWPIQAGKEMRQYCVLKVGSNFSKQVDAIQNIRKEFSLGKVQCSLSFTLYITKVIKISQN